MTDGTGQKSRRRRARRRSDRDRATDAIPLPKRPYRDTAIFYAVLAVLVVVVATATGGSVGRGVAFGAGFFVIATAWSWWRFRKRLEAERAASEKR